MLFGSTDLLCPECYSDEFRLSRFRLSDLPLLVVLRYPIRCRKCMTRFHTSLPQALVIMRKRRDVHSQTLP